MNNDNNQRRNQAAYDSLSNFTRNVADSTARAMNYANPVTFTKNLWNAAGQLPEAMRKYDADYGRRIRKDLYESNHPSPFPTPMNTNRAKVNPPGAETVNNQNVSRNHPQPTNAAPVMKSAPMHEVNLKKYDYSTGQAFTPEQLDTHQREQKLADVNRPSVYDDQQINPSNWGSPGKRYNDMDKSELLTEDGLRAYDDNTYTTKLYDGSVYRPRTEEQRIREGQEAHNRTLRGIAAYQNLNHYRRTGEDKAFPIQGGYDLSGPDPKTLQQQFDNELDVRKLGLDMQKRNDSLRSEPVKNKYKPRYSDVYDDNYNVTGSRFDGSFNESTGQWQPAGQDTAPPLLNQEQFEALSRARQLSSKSDDYTDAYLELLMELGLDPDWYLGYEK